MFRFILNISQMLPGLVSGRSICKFNLTVNILAKNLLNYIQSIHILYQIGKYKSEQL